MRSRAEAQVLQVKSQLIALHYQETGSCFQEDALHAATLLREYPLVCGSNLRQEHRLCHSQIWDAEATSLNKTKLEEKDFCKPNYQIELTSR